MSEFLSLLGARRSIRRFEAAPLKNQEIEMLLKAALLAPSSRDIKPWELIVVEDKTLLAGLSEAKGHGASFLKHAAAGIVVLGNPEMSDVWVEDTAIVSILIHLAAADLGLGSCWIQIRNRTGKSGASSAGIVRETLKIPNPWEVESIIAVGRVSKEDTSPSAPASGKDLSKLEGKIHRNMYQR